MRFLILTGQAAYSHVDQLITTHDLPAKIVALPVSVAAFITPAQVQDALNAENLPDFDFILLPGLIPWDAGKLEKSFAIPIRKGPRNIDDLPAIIQDDLIDHLSPHTAADVLTSQLFADQYSEIEKNHEIAARQVDLPRNFALPQSDLLIGMDLPPCIIAQVMNATELPLEEVLDTARFFAQRGAAIIDVGGVVHQENPDKIAEIVARIRTDVNLPVAVDSMRPAEILAGVNAGAELVLSIDLGNVGVLETLPKDIAIVTIPTNVAAGTYFADPVERVKVLNSLIQQCRAAGFEKILADPLLGAPVQPGLVTSLAGYFLFRHPECIGESPEDVPLLLGAENVFEMVDMDSPGVNGLLSSMAVELQAGAVLVTEYSPKTQNAIDEFRRGIQLSYLAKEKHAPPKDLGISLLIVKSKAKNSLPLDLLLEAQVINPVLEEFMRDPAGFFKIYSNYRGGQVIAAHYANTQELLGVYASDSAESLCKFLLTQKLVTRSDHAAYLGRELAKAEFCVKTGGIYYQED